MLKEKINERKIKPNTVKLLLNGSSIIAFFPLIRLYENGRRWTQYINQVYLE